MSKIVTVKGKNGRRYEVETTLYGICNLTHRLYYGGIYLAGTNEPGPNKESSSSMKITIQRADNRVDELGIEVAGE